jgi:hypothetical protein
MAIAMQHLLSDIERLIKSQKYIAGATSSTGEEIAVESTNQA